MNINNRPISVILILAWTLSLYALWPIPSVQFQLNETSKIIWFNWIAQSVIMILGFGGCVAAIKNTRYWKLVAISASLLFMLNWLRPYILYTAGLPSLDLYLTVLKGALGSKNILSTFNVLYTETLLPFMHVFSVFVVMLVKQKQK